MRFGDSSEYDFRTNRRAKYIYCKVCQSNQSTTLKLRQKNKCLTRQNRRLQLEIETLSSQYQLLRN